MTNKSSISIYLHLTPTSLPHFLYCEGCKGWGHLYPLHKPELEKEERRFDHLTEAERREEMKCQRRCKTTSVGGEQQFLAMIDHHKGKCGAVVKEVRG